MMTMVAMMAMMATVPKTMMTVMVTSSECDVWDRIPEAVTKVATAMVPVMAPVTMASIVPLSIAHLLHQALRL